MNLHTIPRDFAAILLALAFLVPWRGVVRMDRLSAQPAVSSSERLSLYLSTIAFQWIIAAVVAWRALGRLSPQELGLAIPNLWTTLAIAAGLTLILCANQWNSLRHLARLPPEERGFMSRFTEKIMPRGATERLVFTVLGCTAGISEEFLYRGFVFAVFARFFNNSALPAAATALVFSSALFAIAHLYQGARGVLVTFVVGALFAGARIWSGSLLPPMIAHASVDLVAGLCASRFFGVPSDGGPASAALPDA